MSLPYMVVDGREEALGESHDAMILRCGRRPP